MKHGLTMRPTFGVDASSTPVFMQVAASTSKDASLRTRVHPQFSLAERGEVPVEQRLVVLGGSVITWSMPRLEVLADVAYVGFWKEKSTLDGFLRGDVPDLHFMISPHDPNTMLAA